MTSVRLGLRDVDSTSLPYIIAEIGVNHEGSLDVAKDMVRMAHEGGADAAKFQTYQADLIAMKDSPAYWDQSEEVTDSQHTLFSKFRSFTIDDYRELARYCDELGISFCSTPFDHGAVDMIDPLVSFFKIASADITNIPLLRRVASKGKPVILSTGASTLDEARAAVACLQEAGARDIVILHCILNYPTADADAHVRMLLGLREAFPDHLLGYSDHTKPSLDLDTLAVAFGLGAVVLEKHFTLDKTLAGNDHYHSMDRDDLIRGRDHLARVHRLLGGEQDKAPLASEEPARRFARRSIVVARAVAAGATLVEDDLICLRPGTGIGPEHWDEIIGSTTTRALVPEALLQWDDLVVSP
jgi:sialic acid synthase SpsE